MTRFDLSLLWSSRWMFEEEMSDQTPMSQLVQLPGWLQAAGWGLLSASGLLIGAVGGYYTWLQHTTIARVMTFAAGVLLAVVAVDLVIEARGATSLQWIVAGLLCGAAMFSSVNWVLSLNGAKHRKRCGECVAQPTESNSLGVDWRLPLERSSTEFPREWCWD